MTAPFCSPISNVFKLRLFHISLVLAIVNHFYVCLSSVCLSVRLFVSVLGTEPVRQSCPLGLPPPSPPGSASVVCRLEGTMCAHSTSTIACDAGIFPAPVRLLCKQSVPVLGSLLSQIVFLGLSEILYIFWI